MNLVSVIISAYNTELYLRESIDSILGQTHSNLELIIIDDGSTDKSKDILMSYQDDRIKIIHNKSNIGLSKSLNLGIAVARGEYVARLDADDIAEPMRLERQVAFLDAHPEVALLGTWYTEIGGERPCQRSLPCDYTSIRWALLFYCPFVHSAVMWRRTLISSRVGGYNESLRHSMDFELWTRVARSFPVANLGEHLVRVRLHPASMTMTHGDHTLEGHRLRIATVAHLLRWPDRGIGLSAYEERFLALDAVTRGARNGVTPEHALAALDDLFLLQEAFFEEAGIRAGERRHLRIALRRIVARNLVGLASRGRSAPGGIKASLRLLATASRVWARSLLPIAPRSRVLPSASNQRTSSLL